MDYYINSDRRDLLICGFRDSNTDCIINIRICNINQTSYLTRKSANSIKSTENGKALPRTEKAFIIPFVASCEVLLGMEAKLSVLLKVVFYLIGTYEE